MKSMLRRLSREQSAKLTSRRSPSPTKLARASTMPASLRAPGIANPNVNDIVRTRVLIVSDTHVAPLLGQNDARDLPFKQPLPSADVLIHCGMLLQYLVSIYDKVLI